MIGSLVVLTGASGSGKTTLAKRIQERYPKECEVMFFDSVGVPSSEEMKKWGGQDPECVEHLLDYLHRPD
jgi:uridine kinase